MNIPKYILDQESYIAINGQSIDNHSLAQYRNQTITIDKDGNYYLFLNNYQLKALTLKVKSNRQVQLYLISYNSKKTSIDISVQLEAHALLKLYTQFNARRKTTINIKRVFDISQRASLILLNNLTYHGTINLNDDVYLNGEQANLDIDLLNINSHQDESVVLQQVYHRAKKTYSQINNWLISNEQSKLNYVVNGTIEKGHEKSSCQQLNKGIILSEKGQIKVIPSLYIDEYDVEASHGAAIGQIDENQMFYLQSRGMTEIGAKNLIISGYINPFLTKIKNNRIETLLKRRIKHLL